MPARAARSGAGELTAAVEQRRGSMAELRGPRARKRSSYYYGRAGPAFHTLRSSKRPSLPATPSSIFDLVAWAMPEDLR